MNATQALATLREVAARTEPRHERPKSDAELAEEMRLEQRGEASKDWRRWGGSDRDGDRVALAEEDRMTRAAERFLR